MAPPSTRDPQPALVGATSSARAPASAPDAPNPTLRHAALASARVTLQVPFPTLPIVVALVQLPATPGPGPTIPGAGLANDGRVPAPDARSKARVRGAPASLAAIAGIAENSAGAAANRTAVAQGLAQLVKDLARSREPAVPSAAVVAVPFRAPVAPTPQRPTNTAHLAAPNLAALAGRVPHPAATPQPAVAMWTAVRAAYRQGSNVELQAHAGLAQHRMRRKVRASACRKFCRAPAWLRAARWKTGSVPVASP